MKMNCPAGFAPAGQFDAGKCKSFLVLIYRWRFLRCSPGQQVVSVGFMLILMWLYVGSVIGYILVLL